METIIEIRWNSILKNITARARSLLVVEETDFPASENHFFLSIFRDSCQFYPSSTKVFFNQILHSGWWKRIFWLVENVFVCSEFFLQVKTVSKIKHILTNENWFLVKWKPFPSIFLGSSQLIPVEAVFHLTRTYWKRGKEVFICFVYCFIPSFFL